MEWISVKDRLPEDNFNTVLCFGIVAGKGKFKGDNWMSDIITVGYIHENKFYTHRDSNNEDIDVTHWMPLPTPPKS